MHPTPQELEHIYFQDLKRKTSHSIIERRRRDRINDKIMVLKTIVPGLERNLPKLAVLEGTIDYIMQLQEQINILQAKDSMKLSNLIHE